MKTPRERAIEIAYEVMGARSLSRELFRLVLEDSAASHRR